MKNNGKKKKNINPYGWAGVYISYTNIYHVCLNKLLIECSEAMGECKGCPVHNECITWWANISDFKARYSSGIGITTETFPMLVLQFSKFRDKAREKAHQATKENGKLYQKELANASI